MLKNYLKIAIKVLLRRKFFTFISLFGIAFTLVVLMVVTALFDHVFAPARPEVRQERSLAVYIVEIAGERNRRNGPPGYGFLDKHVRTLPDVEKVSVFSVFGTVLSYKDGRRIESYLKRTDGEFWQILDFEFLEGAPFTSEDDNKSNFVAVINETTRRKFFGDASAVGKTIEADGQRFRVVGVVRDVPILRILPFADIWVPISTAKSTAYRTEVMGDFMALILARSSADFPAIRDEFRSRLSQVELPRGFNRMSGQVETFFETVSRFFSPTGDTSHPWRLLAAIVALMVLFMLLPTINLVNINVSRIMERASEIGVRKAFGASSRNLVGQFVVENLVLTLIGGVLGFAGAYLVLRTISLSGVIPYADLHLNLRIFGYGLAIAVFFGLFSGVYPAWKMSRLHPVQALKGASR